MADETNITPLNFNHGIIGKTIMDKKAGVEIYFGYMSGLPEEYSDLFFETRGLAIALQDVGITQDLLDRACRKLTEDCRIGGLKILITKSDMFFDRRWFFLGDIEGLVDGAKKGRFSLPISDFLYDNVLEEIERFS